MPATTFATALPNAEISLAGQHLRLGLEHDDAGGTDEAIAVFQPGLAAVENEPPGTDSAEMISKLRAKLGDAAMLQGDFESAATNYRAALRVAPHLTDCWCNFGNLQLKTGKYQEAIALYLQALRLNSRHWAARTNLAQALMATQQFILAKAVLLELKGERPQESQISHQLGRTHFELNELELAIESFREAAALNPRDAESINWIGAIKQMMGDIEGAQLAYAEAARIQPLIRRVAAKFPAEFRILTLYAPFGGNTPTEYLFQDAFYDTDTLALFASREYDGALCGRDVQLVVNLISDADQTEALLPVAADLIDRFDLPTIN